VPVATTYKFDLEAFLKDLVDYVKLWQKTRDVNDVLEGLEYCLRKKREWLYDHKDFIEPKVLGPKPDPAPEPKKRRSKKDKEVKLVRCKDHPHYGGIKRPRTTCSECSRLFNEVRGRKVK
jgi:hypothetical protein